MIFESKYQIYLKEEAQNFVLKIKMGFVYFERSVIVNKNEEIRIKRTDNKNRQRPGAHKRHGSNACSQSNMNFELVD